jgi:hypothetical protein
MDGLVALVAGGLQHGRRGGSTAGCARLAGPVRSPGRMVTFAFIALSALGLALLSLRQRLRGEDALVIAKYLRDIAQVEVAFATYERLRRGRAEKVFHSRAHL